MFVTTLLVLLLAIAPGAGQANSGGVIQGTSIATDIVGDTTWTSAGSPYLVTASIRVADVATLTLEPGVEVNFVAGVGMRIEGGLNAQGTQERQVRIAGNNGATWLGLTVVQPTRNVVLQSVTLQNAIAGLTIRQENPQLPRGSARVDVLDSLFTANGIGIDADYSVLAAAPSLTLRNNLLTSNQIGLQINSLPGGNIRPKLTHNSFTANGVGVNALNISGNGLRMQQHWWGSPDGPIANTAACGSPPVPGISARDLVCGAVDFTPWSKVPSGRTIVPAGQGAIIETAIGPGALNDDDLASTSVLTLTVPAGAFTETVDLLATARDIASAPPGQPTQLGFEITAAAGGQAIHRFANGRQLALEIRYIAADLNGADPNKLVVYYLDEDTGAWSFAGIRTTPDPANQRLIASLDHLTRMRVTAVDLKTTRLPLVLH
jgi:hypothetical protein